MMSTTKSCTMFIFVEMRSPYWKGVERFIVTNPLFLQKTNRLYVLISTTREGVVYLIENVSKFNDKHQQLFKLREHLNKSIKNLLLEKGLLYVAVGFFLGRAVILSVVSPFAIAFLATLWMMQRRQLIKGMLATLIGAFSYSFTHGTFIALAIILFMLLSGLFKQAKNKQIIIPLIVFLSTVAPRLFLYSLNEQLSAYEWMLLGTEGILGTVLVLIFMQSIPLLSPHKYKPTLKNEEIVC